MLWKAQNAKIFQDNSWHIWRIISQIQILHQYINCSNRRAITYKQQREVLWKRPPPTAIKINTNGSSLGNPGKVGYGGLFRDHLRNWISWILRKLWDINEFESIIVCCISWTPNSMEWRIHNHPLWDWLQNGDSSHPWHYKSLPSIKSFLVWIGKLLCNIHLVKPTHVQIGYPSMVQVKINDTLFGIIFHLS